MLSDIDLSRCMKRGPSAPAPALALLLASLCLAGCGTASTQMATPVSSTPIPVQPATVPSVASGVALPLPPDATISVLAYADRIRVLQGNELTQEITRLGEAETPGDQLRLAMALVQTRQLYDLVRGQDLLQRVLANNSTEARALHPLARLLITRFAEQRRIEDQLDRQGQQLRDTQRRLDQTNDKLEALKEIERSLTPRPGASAPAASRNRPRTATQ